MAVIRKKLYFLANFNAATSGLLAADGRVFPCTAFRGSIPAGGTVTKSYQGDLYGGVLQDLPPLTNGSPIEKKRRNDVSAWVRNISSDDAAALATGVQRFVVDFVNATTDAAVATILQTSSMLGFAPTDAVGPTGTAVVIGVDGVTPVLTRHFGVRVRRKGSSAATGKVMLYVQRQHSIEV